MSEILLLSGTQIFPALSGGQVRSSNFAMALAEAGYKVRLVCLTGRKREYLKGKGDEVQAIGAGLEQHIHRSKLNGILQFLCYRWNLPDLWLDHSWWRWLIPKSLDKLIKKADLVIFDSPFTLPIKSLAGDKPCVLLSHNSEWQRWSEMKLHRLSLRVLRLEQKAAQSLDLILACADQDAVSFKSYGAQHIMLIQNGISMNRLIASPSQGQKLRSELGFLADDRVIIFTASQYAPNKVALDFLLSFHEQYAKTLEKLKISIMVVGSVANTAVNLGRLVLTGPVEQIGPYFAAADAAINPIVAGSGTNVKMFEYIALGLPVLCTWFGSRGLDFKDGEDGLCFEPHELLVCLHRFAALDSKSLGLMAESLFSKNRHQIFMNEIVAKNLVPKLEGLLDAYKKTCPA